MASIKPFYVMMATPSGHETICETRFGRNFKSIDAACRLAAAVGGSVYERLKSGSHVLRLDAELQIKTIRNAWRKS